MMGVGAACGLGSSSALAGGLEEQKLNTDRVLIGLGSLMPLGQFNLRNQNRNLDNSKNR